MPISIALKLTFFTTPPTDQTTAFEHHTGNTDPYRVETGMWLKTASPIQIKRKKIGILQKNNGTLFFFVSLVKTSSNEYYQNKKKNYIVEPADFRIKRFYWEVC
jgi:hypothetical protein